jgi:hypothetical protein
MRDTSEQCQRVQTHLHLFIHKFETILQWIRPSVHATTKHSTYADPQQSQTKAETQTRPTLYLLQHALVLRLHLHAHGRDLHSPHAFHLEVALATRALGHVALQGAQAGLGGGRAGLGWAAGSGGDRGMDSTKTRTREREGIGNSKLR